MMLSFLTDIVHLIVHHDWQTLAFGNDVALRNRQLTTRPLPEQTFAMPDDYKAAKEAFVSGMTGSSITHINLISLVALIAVALYAAICTRVAPIRSIGFLVSWTILVLPMLLSMTLSANQPVYLGLVLLVPTIALLFLPRTEIGTPLPSRQPASPSAETRSLQNRTGGARIPPLPALTTYRAHMMLMTVLAILAVDFPVFPRSLAKCETYGVSLMDLGVGSFVFSQGVVSAIPLVKDPYYLGSPILPKLRSVTMKCLPVIALGVARVLLVKGTEYPEHVTEYGVHWNFFITLALLPVLQVFLHPIFQHVSISMAGLLVALVQQMTLSKHRLPTRLPGDPAARTLSWHAHPAAVAQLLQPETESSVEQWQQGAKKKRQQHVIVGK
ncbi:hypothetical protein NLJ89_g10855 [Agrocybe chaxingu]|uniref:GPI-anchored wall transfer protein 1 n=1 Tax=Agrocybe chaxingu TaxID=84603 RepID=A0A9W8MRQ5_9AGAR|nr:hypothetical protein NLJ89_g10855 [Agrocybe chaxingu]